MRTNVLLLYGGTINFDGRPMTSSLICFATWYRVRTSYHYNT